MKKDSAIAELTDEQLAAEVQRRKIEKQEVYNKSKVELANDNEEFVSTTVARFNELHTELSELKNRVITKANKLYNRMYEIEGKEPKEVKSFSRVSKDGTMKITVDRQERLVFTDEAEVHIQAIRDIFKKKFEGRNKGFYNLLDSILMKGRKGEYDPKLLAKARQQVAALGDPNLIEEFNKLELCQRVEGTSLYARAYQKDDKGKWQDIVIQFSAL
ncbi:MAG: DUF3164 family protein [Bacteroidota bacterium]